MDGIGNAKMRAMLIRLALAEVQVLAMIPAGSGWRKVLLRKPISSQRTAGPWPTQRDCWRSTQMQSCGGRHPPAKRKYVRFNKVSPLSLRGFLCEQEFY